MSSAMDAHSRALADVMETMEKSFAGTRME